METRKQCIEEIMASMNAAKHKIHGKILGRTLKSPITHSQWFVLSIVESRKNIGIKDIAKMLGVTSSATTQLVDALVKNGYVNRKTDAADRRSLNLHVSPKAQKQIKKMKAVYFKSMEAMFKKLTTKELKTYSNLHKKITTK